MAVLTPPGPSLAIARKRASCCCPNESLAALSPTIAALSPTIAHCALSNDSLAALSPVASQETRALADTSHTASHTRHNTTHLATHPHSRAQHGRTILDAVGSPQSRGSLWRTELNLLDPRALRAPTAKRQPPRIFPTRVRGRLYFVTTDCRILGLTPCIGPS